MNFLYNITETANASPKASCEVVLDVGTIPKPASFTFGINIPISELLNSNEFFFEVMPINLTLFLLQKFIIFFNSIVSPELLIKINKSFFEITPRSP